MKKLIKISFLAILIISVFVLSSCNASSKSTYLATIVYTQYFKEHDKEIFMVYVPGVNDMNVQITGVDGAVLPALESVNDDGEKVVFEEWDVVILEFKGDLLIRQETTPKAFVNLPYKGVLKMKGVEVKEEKNQFTLSVPIDKIRFGETASVGTELKFFNREESFKKSENPTYSAIITAINGKKAQITVKENELLKLVSCLSYGGVSA